LYSKDKTIIIRYPEAKTGTSFTISNSVTTIMGGVFYGGTKLTSITIPNSVTFIGNSAFSYTSITSIIIPASVTSIWNTAFFDCYSLTSVTFQGTISEADFVNYPDDDDLRAKYLAGGPGTYTRPSGLSTVWTKQ